MPENIRALVVILLLGLIVFNYAKKIIPENLTDKNLKLFRNIWLTVVITGFLSYNFWLFLLFISIFITKITKKEPNKVAVFFILVFAMPNLTNQVPGMGILNYLMTITYPRFISVLILLPAALLISKKNNLKFLSLWSDKFLLMYILISALASLRHTTFTDALRHLLYGYTDLFLPYYVASRGIKNIDEMKHALFAFMTIAIITSIFAIFEYTRNWLLFSRISDSLGIIADMGGYMIRSGNIRAVASMEHPLILGSFLVIAINFYLSLETTNNKLIFKRIFALILILGMVSTISRGPWLASIASFVIFLKLSKDSFKNLATFLLIFAIIFTGLSATPKGEKYINMLPFFSSESSSQVNSNEQFNVKYREKLLENSITVINKYPFFGSSDYLAEPEMQELIQGEGIVDIVNTYVGIALQIGYVGLSIFIGLFVTVLYGIYSKMLKVKYKYDSFYTMGACLIAAISGFMISITSTSMIGVMPIMCLSMLGLGVAYTKIVNDYLNS